MNYKYVINGIGVESFGDLYNNPLLICSDKSVAKAIRYSFERAMKEIACEDIDSRDIQFYEYEDKDAVFTQVRNELKLLLPETEDRNNEMINKLFDGLYYCMAYTNPIIITKLPYI